ncbi:Fur family transcriptional regulator [Hoeflea sp. CAU 1731]
MNTILDRKLVFHSLGAVSEGLRMAEAACQQRGLQFTEIRRFVLECLWQSGQPIRAYELLRMLGQKFGRPLSPPTVYRALEFLQEQGFVTRIETKNAFEPCAFPDRDHACVFFICDQCGNSFEVQNAKAEALFEEDAGNLGFQIDKRVIELHGACASCLSSEATSN